MLVVRLLFLLPLFLSSEVHSLTNRIPFSSENLPETVDIVVNDEANDLMSKTSDSEISMADNESVDSGDVQVVTNDVTSFAGIWNSFTLKEKYQFALGCFIIVFATILGIREAL